MSHVNVTVVFYSVLYTYLMVVQAFLKGKLSTACNIKQKSDTSSSRVCFVLFVFQKARWK